MKREVPMSEEDVSVVQTARHAVLCYSVSSIKSVSVVSLNRGIQADTDCALVREDEEITPRITPALPHEERNHRTAESQRWGGRKNIQLTVHYFLNLERDIFWHVV